MYLFKTYVSTENIRVLHLTERDTVKSLSRVQLFVTPWTVACQAPPSMGFSRQEYWNALPFPSPGDLPDPVIKPGSPALQADTFPSEPRQAQKHYILSLPLQVSQGNRGWGS